MPNCSIISCKSRSFPRCFELSGLGFYRFPRNPDYREKWVEATGRRNWVPTKNSTVCSKHFEDDDFLVSPCQNRRLLFPSAIPHINVCKIMTFKGPVVAYNESNPESNNKRKYKNEKETVDETPSKKDFSTNMSGRKREHDHNGRGETVNGSSLCVVVSSVSADPLEDVKPVLACRGCLVTEQPLRLLDGKLSDTYGLLISPVKQCDMYPKFICLYCSASLLRFRAFREKCLSIQTALDDIHSGGCEITLDLIQTGIIKTSYPLERTEIETITLDPDYAKPLPNQQLNAHDTVNQNSSETLKSNQNNDVIKTVESCEENGFDYDVKAVEPYLVDINIMKSSDDISQMANENEQVDINSFFNTNLDLPDFFDKIQNLDVSVKDEPAETQIEENLTTDSEYSDENTVFDNVTSDGNEYDSTEESETENLSSKPKDPCKDIFKPIRDLIKRLVYLRNLKNYKNKKYLLKTNARRLGVILKTLTDEKRASNEARFSKESGGGADDYKLSFEDCKTWIKTLKAQRKSNKTDPLEKYEAERKEKLILDDMNELGKEFNFKTVLLSREQQIQQIQDRKESLKYKKARFKCELCYVVFRANLTLNKHVDAHKLIEGNTLCEVCSKSVNNNKMTEHIEKSHKFDYVCNQCQHISKSLETAKLHHRWHQGVTYDCKICGKSFDKHTSVMGHMLLSHKDEMISCSICDHKCNGDKGLRQHINLSHKEAIGAVCATCGVQFHSVDAMQRHRPQGDCDQNLRACAACGEGFATVQLLQMHKSDNHTWPDYVCEICHRAFDDKVKYIVHVAYNKHKVNPSTTEGQPRKIKTPCDNGNETNKTVKIKKKPYLYMCDICGRRNKSRNKFEDHCRMHTGEKPFICDYCGMRFTTKAVLGIHINRHMGINGKMRNSKKDCRCRYCGKQYTRLSSRWSHEMAKHKNRDKYLYKKSIKPIIWYDCGFCGKRFNLKANMLRHEKTYHKGTMRFTCEICRGTFTTKHSMREHVRHAHEGVPWPKRQRIRNKRQEHTAAGDG